MYFNCLLFSSGTIKKIVVRNIQDVGMHHHDRRALDRLGTYTVDIEPNNPYHPTAVAVYDGTRKAGNLRRDSAKAIHDIITANKAKSRYFLRPIKESRVLSRRTGP